MQHLMVKNYPKSFKLSYKKYKEAFAAGGWVDYVDYTDNYASCIGEELYSEQVLNFPKN